MCARVRASMCGMCVCTCVRVCVCVYVYLCVCIPGQEDPRASKKPQENGLVIVFFLKIPGVKAAQLRHILIFTLNEICF